MGLMGCGRNNCDTLMAAYQNAIAEQVQCAFVHADDAQKLEQCNCQSYPKINDAAQALVDGCGSADAATKKMWSDMMETSKTYMAAHCGRAAASNDLHAV